MSASIYLIQKQRYGDKLEYEINENPAFDNLVLPKLVLQPLVENALYHGIKEKEGQGHIRVSVQKQDSGLVIRIEDDGIGFQDASDSSQSQLKTWGELVFKMLINGSNFTLENIIK